MISTFRRAASCFVVVASALLVAAPCLGVTRLEAGNFAEVDRVLLAAAESKSAFPEAVLIWNPTAFSAKADAQVMIDALHFAHATDTWITESGELISNFRRKTRIVTMAPTNLLVHTVRSAEMSQWLRVRYARNPAMAKALLPRMNDLPSSLKGIGKTLRLILEADLTKPIRIHAKTVHAVESAFSWPHPGVTVVWDRHDFRNAEDAQLMLDLLRATEAWGNFIRPNGTVFPVDAEFVRFKFISPRDELPEQQRAEALVKWIKAHLDHNAHSIAHSEWIAEALPESLMFMAPALTAEFRRQQARTTDFMNEDSPMFRAMDLGIDLLPQPPQARYLRVRGRTCHSVFLSRRSLSKVSTPSRLD